MVDYRMSWYPHELKQEYQGLHPTFTFGIDTSLRCFQILYQLAGQDFFGKSYLIHFDCSTSKLEKWWSFERKVFDKTNNERIVAQT